MDRKKEREKGKREKVKFIGRASSMFVRDILAFRKERASVLHEK